MQPEVRDKQNLIYDQIINKNYNQEKFLQFLVRVDPLAGTNINQWTMPNLELAVEKFKKQQCLTQEQKQQRATIGMYLQEQPIVYNTTNQAFCKKVSCIKLQHKPVQVKISIDGIQKKDGGVFSKGYFVYRIKTVFMKINPQTKQYNQEIKFVWRRYKDFQWLRNILILLHPSLPIAPLPGKGKMRIDYDKHVYKRMLLLQKFLIKMNCVPEIKVDQIFQTFLLTQVPQEFEKYKSSLKNINSMLPLEKVKNQSGELTLLLSQETSMFITQSKKYLAAAQPQVKQIYKDFKGVATQLQISSDILQKLSANCINLQVGYRQFKTNCFLPNKQKNIYFLLSQISHRYSQILRQQAKSLRRQMYSLIKYQSLYMVGLNESLTRLQQIQTNYYQQKQVLLKKKQKLFEENNTTKWQLSEPLKIQTQIKEEAFALMLPKQTLMLIKMREDYALVNYQIYVELIRFFNQNQQYLYRHFLSFCNKSININQRKLQLWEQTKENTHGMDTPQQSPKKKVTAQR